VPNVKRFFTSDCEGPISKNDNAYEITAHYVPDGKKLFTVISRYDDVLAEILKRPGYKAGDTLKLILPFLKAYGVTDEKMEEFSANSLVLISGAKDTLQHIRSVTDAFIVSTSYEHYIRAMCKALAFPCENAYCTRVKLDKYDLSGEECFRLKRIAQEIARMPMFDIPPNARSLKDFPIGMQKVIQGLDELFWKEIAGMNVGRILSEANPMGGREKAVAVRDIAERLDTGISGCMYVGDSITDEEAIKLVRKHGGFTVSFNGNQYAVENAEVAVLSENSIVTAVIADVFCRFGKRQALDLAAGWSREGLRKSQVNPVLLNLVLRLFSNELPKVKITTSENMENLVTESSEFRNKVRGEAAGRLG
jgi:energy-converting hydrogenase A subunit R